jgi:parvulin-like peptidyl-prolyl isomerase
MRKAIAILLATFGLASAASAQQVIDRTVAQIGGSVITQSQIVELGRFQKLVDGKEQSASQRLNELAQQWIVKRDAALNDFPTPSAQEVQRALAELEKRFGSAAAFEQHLKSAGLSASEARRLLDREMFLSRYLDYKFRPEVRVDEQQIEEYYRNTLVPELKKTGQAVPPIARVADQVREVLVERGVTQRAEHWLDQMQQEWKLSPVGGSTKPSE